MENSNEILISIIVPVYRVEKYLSRCMNSILNQTYENIDIILVDDGSDDSCPQLCDSYNLKDNRIKVIHKTNGGLSDARNYGLSYAQGSYILFVDSDDYIELNTCEKFINCIKRNSNEVLDVIIGNANVIENNKKYKYKHNSLKEGIIYNKYSYWNIVLSNKEYFVPVWMNLYRKDYLIDNNLYFQFGIFHEDEEWMPRVIWNSDKISYLDFCFYNYIIRKGSISKNSNYDKNINDIMDTLNKLYNYYKKNIDRKDIQYLLIYDVINKFLYYSCKFSISKKTRDNYINFKIILNNVNIKLKLKILFFKNFYYLYKGLFILNEIIKFRR